MNVDFMNSIHQTIINEVCDFYQVEHSDIIIPNRKREVVTVKQVSAFFIKRAMPRSTLKQIAISLKCNYATVIHSLKTIKNLIEVDSCIKDDINKLSHIFTLKGILDDPLPDERLYYYVDLQNCTSLKISTKKAIVFTGMTPAEIQEIIESMPNIKTPQQKDHKNTGLLLIEKL
jgi:hypothetical protein